MQRPGPDLAAHRWSGGHGPSHYPTSAGEGNLAGLLPVMHCTVLYLHILRMLDTFSEITVLTVREHWSMAVIYSQFALIEYGEGWTEIMEIWCWWYHDQATNFLTSKCF